MDTKKSLRAKIDHLRAELSLQRTVTKNLAHENEMIAAAAVKLDEELKYRDREIRDRALDQAINSVTRLGAVDVVALARSYEAYLSGAVAERHNEGTMVKVYDSLSKSFPDLADFVIRDVVTEMQNAGILFRERIDG